MHRGGRESEPGDLNARLAKQGGVTLQDLAPRGGLELARQLRLDGRGEGRIPGDEQGRGVGTVFRLGEQVGGHVDGVRGAVGLHGDQVADAEESGHEARLGALGAEAQKFVAEPKSLSISAKAKSRRGAVSRDRSR